MWRVVERTKSMSRVDVGDERAMSQGVPRWISHYVGREELTRDREREREMKLQGEVED